MGNVEATQRDEALMLGIAWDPGTHPRPEVLGNIVSSSLGSATPDIIYGFRDVFSRNLAYRVIREIQPDSCCVMRLVGHRRGAAQ